MNTEPGTTGEDQFEAGYIAGMKAAYSEMLSHAFKVLGIDDPEGHAAHLYTDMQAVVSAVKSLWEDVRDDPYPEDLYLPDVIEKIAGEFIP